MENKPAAEDATWAAVKTDYHDKTIPIHTIARTHGVSRGAILTRARTEGWTARSKASQTQRALAHLRTMAETIRARLATQLEKEGEGDTAAAGALLLKLVQAYERISELESRRRTTTPAPPIDRARQDAADREMIDRHVERWARAMGFSRPAGRARGRA